jgi:hypothetical protein
MTPRDYLVHERTLAGAVDSFLKGLVHVRPNLVSRYEKMAEAWMDAWFDAGGANAVEAVDAAWIADYLVKAGPDREQAERFLDTFYQWAERENLMDAGPLRQTTS